MSAFLRKILAIIILPGIVLLLVCCKQKKTVQKIDFRSFVDFRFRKIQMYLDDSIKYFKAIDSLYADLAPNIRAYEVYSCKRGFYSNYRRNPEKALLYADSILMSTKNLEGEDGYVFWYANALFNMADDLSALKRYREAFRYYFLARETIFQTGDTCLFSEYSERLAFMAYRHRSYRSAATYFKQAFEQREVCGRTNNMYDEHVVFSNQQATLDNIGLCYGKLGISDTAIMYYDSALHYIDKNQHVAFQFVNQQKIPDTDFVAMARAVIYGNKAQELMALGQNEEAEQLLVRSIAMNSRRTRAIEDVPYSLAKLSDLYIRTNRLAEASVSLRQLHAVLDTMQNTDMLIKWHLLSAHLDAKRGDLVQSKKTMDRYLYMKDSLEMVNLKVLAMDIEGEFDHMKTSMRLNNLQKADTRKNAYLIIAGISVLFCLLIAFLIWYNYAQSRKHVNVLATLNNKISVKNGRLEKALSELQQTQEEKNRLMRVVAHDLRNPIGGIAGATEFLLKADNYTGEQKRILETINQSSKHAVLLIQEMMQGRDETPANYTVDLQDLVKYCVDLLKIPAADKAQQLILNSTTAKVKGDKEQLWRVFSNLIGNAIKFSPQGKLINIDFSLNNDSVVVAVKDEGIGIPDSLKDKLFSSSAAIGRKGTGGEPSFGMGLRICKEIVEDHEGRIWAENNAEKGSSFFVSLPLAV